MSDWNIMTNMSFPSGAGQSKTPAGKRKRKGRWFRKKMQFVRRKGLQEGKSIHNHGPGQAGLVLPRQNGAVTQHPRLPTSTSDTSSPGSLATCPKPSTSMPSQTKAGTQCPRSSQKPGATRTSIGIPSKFLAIDCEMVGTGPKGRICHLARCSVVSHDGDVVYDKFIKPSVPVTDFRTRWSGVRPRDLVNATPYPEARKEILKLLMGKVVIGHAIHNDFKALGYTHPAALTRDTSRIPLLNAKAGFAKEEVASLKRLTKALFNRDIQTGRKGHSSVEDAQATMQLYRVVEADWERELASRSQAS